MGPDTIDEALVAEASALLRQRGRPGWHWVAAACRTREGRVFAAVNVGAYVTRIGVCAEAVAIGMAVAAGDADLERVVAVMSTGDGSGEVRVVSPCGMCREMIADYAPDALVLIERGGQATRVPVGQLLPDRYRRTTDQDFTTSNNY